MAPELKKSTKKMLQIKYVNEVREYESEKKNIRDE